MRESDFLALKRELWEIIRSEGIVVTNQNLDWLLEKVYVLLAKKNANEILSSLCHSISVNQINLNEVTSKGN